MNQSSNYNRALLESAAKRSIEYLDGLGARRVGVSAGALADLRELAFELPAEPMAAESVLDLLDRFGSPATVASAGGRYFGFVIGGSLPAALAANWLAAAWDQNAAMEATSPVAAKLEGIVSSWLLDMFGLPAGAAVGFVPSDTVAIFTCLAAARRAVLERVGWDADRQGLFGAPPVTVVVGEEAHVTVHKCLGLLGLGRERVVAVPCDSQGRMCAGEFPRLEGPAIVCIQAGNVNTGSFDPAEEICAAAHQHGAWVHVDGAFGLWAATAPERSHLLHGFAQADSWATDAHKWLNVPYDSAVAIVREPRHLCGAMALSAAYLQSSGTRNPSNYHPSLSLRARAIEIWAALASLGRTGVADLIERTCRFATRFAEGLRAAGYEILNQVVLNQVLVSFGDDDTTRAVIAAIQEDGTCWCGGTVWHGRAAMRISVSGWATTEADVDRSLAAMLRLAGSVKQPALAR